VTVPSIIAGLCLLAALFSVFCRIHKMDPKHTRPIVIVQHFSLGMGIGCALFVPNEWRWTLLAAGVMVFLLLSSYRWKDEAPEGTKCAPRYLTADEARQVAGGGK
jgi:peptidoglycan/LPS O-acetylase OafA/YrhL